MYRFLWSTACAAAVLISSAAAADPACDPANDTDLTNPPYNQVTDFSGGMNGYFISRPGNVTIRRNDGNRLAQTTINSANCSATAIVADTAFTGVSAAGTATVIADSISRFRPAIVGGGQIVVQYPGIAASSSAGDVFVQAGVINSDKIVSVSAFGTAAVTLGTARGTYGVTVTGRQGVVFNASAITVSGGFAISNEQAVDLSSALGTVSATIDSVTFAPYTDVSRSAIKITAPAGGVNLNVNTINSTAFGNGIDIVAAGPVNARVGISATVAPAAFGTSIPPNVNAISIVTSSTASLDIGFRAPIDATGPGIRVAAAAGATLNNAGRIFGFDGSGSSRVTINNTGDLTDGIVLSPGDDTIIATGGLLGGTIDGGAGRDVVRLQNASGLFSAISGVEEIIAVNGGFGTYDPTFSTPIVVRTDAAISLTNTAYSTLLTAAGFGRIETTGAVVINGGMVSLLRTNATGIPRVTRGVVLAGSSVSGRFAGISDFDQIFDYRLDYTPTSVIATAVRTDITYPGFARTPNQAAAASAIEAAGLGTPVFDLLGALNIASIADALPALTGEDYASVLTFALESDQRIARIIGDRIGDAPSQNASVWSTAFGSDTAWSGDAALASADMTAAGIALGADRAYGSVRVGLAGLYARERIEGGLIGDASQIDAYALALYAGYEAGPFKALGGAVWSIRSIESARTIGLAAVDARPAATYDVSGYQLFGDASWRFGGDQSGFEPYAALAVERLSRGSFAETGSPAPLYAERTARDAVFYTLGLRGDFTSVLSQYGDTLGLKASVAWRGVSGDVAETEKLSFLSGGPAFEVTGIPLPDDAFEAGASISVTGAWGRVEFAYTGDFADRWTTHGVRLTGTVAF